MTTCMSAYITTMVTHNMCAVNAHDRNAVRVTGTCAVYFVAGRRKLLIYVYAIYEIDTR